MNFKGSVDTKELEKALQAVASDPDSLLRIEGTGAAVQINGQRMRVAVDTAATKNSVGSHIEEASTTIIDEIGPETDYAWYIENGVQSKPNYPIQPFVRPTAEEDFDETVEAMGRAFGAEVLSKWPK